MIALFSHRDSHLIVGLEDDQDGSLRVYLDARYSGIHTHVADEDAKTELRAAWANNRSHITTRVPNEALCDCPPPAAESETSR